jgi:hypothetical protein
MDLRRLDPSTRNLLLDAGFILGTLVVALASYFVIRAATDSGEAPRADVAGVIATVAVTATATAQSAPPSPTPSLIVTTTPSPTPAPTATPQGTPGAGLTEPPLDILAALGRDEPFICEAAVSVSQDGSKRRAVTSWNQLTGIWNRLAESEGQLNAAIPSPFTLENAAASEGFLNEARRHEQAVLTAIDELVALRAAGIHTVTREMSLQQGDFYDLERLTIQSTIAGVANQDVDAWNEGVFLEEQRQAYLESARTEMRAVCDFVKQP